MAKKILLGIRKILGIQVEINKNENSKRFVSLLDIKSKNGNRGIWGSSAEKNSIWEEMYDAEPRGRFIQFYRATSSPDLNQRIKKLEELREKWGEPNNAAVINYLGYLYYQSGNKEKSKDCTDKANLQRIIESSNA